LYRRLPTLSSKADAEFFSQNKAGNPFCKPSSKQLEYARSIYFGKQENPLTNTLTDRKKIERNETTETRYLFKRKLPAAAALER
jgi:hypothetical protein